MRACLCYEVSDRDGEEKSLQSVQENKDFIDYCEAHPSDMLKPLFGGHALFTISDKTFDRMVRPTTAAWAITSTSPRA
jgi:cytosine/adenosine deaminase-related metal-dependent hydrolase